LLFKDKIIERLNIYEESPENYQDTEFIELLNTCAPLYTTV